MPSVGLPPPESPPVPPPESPPVPPPESPPEPPSAGYPDSVVSIPSLNAQADTAAVAPELSVMGLWSCNGHWKVLDPLWYPMPQNL